MPFFVGRDPLSRLAEPLYAIGGTLGVYLTGVAWAGAVVFDRSDIDEEAFLADLRRAVSDDGLLTDRVEITPRRGSPWPRSSPCWCRSSPSWLRYWRSPR